MDTLRWFCIICLFIQFASSLTNVVQNERKELRGTALFVAFYTLPVVYFVWNYRG